MKQKKLPTELELESISEIFKILSEPMRLKILCALKGTELSVNEIVEQTGAQQANISRHLNQLKMTGIVTRRKEGTKAIYYILNDAVFALCYQACFSDRKLKKAKDFFKEMA